jgi:hypothetical protein
MKSDLSASEQLWEGGLRLTLVAEGSAFGGGERLRKRRGDAVN